MDFMYYANEDGTSYLFTRDYNYKKDVSAGLPASNTAGHLKSSKTFKGDGLRDQPTLVRRPLNVGRKVQPEDVLAYALAHPQRSTKMISESCGLSKSRVGTILNESGAHPYRSTPVQGLLPRDAERR
ncbi:hypothetical protein AVEN_60502-1 [Araneus ventricosus]|uniref:Uncharacterized protein n=1 Tax=Araneus ventricosus TaxID=182803 RepID=A0A4Y2G7D0_ARAVE|nr:hypothetical protein AVEN_60502-1 [Araneus ventricosus]